MTTSPRNHVSDLRGAGRLAVDAIAGVTELVEAVQESIARPPSRLGGPLVDSAVAGIAGVVYQSIRGITQLVGGSIDLALGAIASALAEVESTPRRDAIVAALNGVLGDHLAETGNPLAIDMRFRVDGKTLALDRDSLAASLGAPADRIVLLMHGLCMNDAQWKRAGHDHGAGLARELGYTAVYLRYNSGRHISSNGYALAGALDALTDAWPRPLSSIVVVGHSMGGLVARSAVHYASGSPHSWARRLLHKMVFLGSPHHGAPLERGGNRFERALGVTPYTAPFARLGKLRSAGITDLRHGYLLDDDWRGRDRFAAWAEPPTPVPLPEWVDCYAIAATLGKEDAPVRDRLIGDGLVPVPSALGRHEDPQLSLRFRDDQCALFRATGHLDLLNRREVFERVRDWIAE